ncbi:MAG: PPC domain-containing protein [Anaerolineae bacterium]|jgi:hypothetical protein|nr:PPC domain-containing protein [Anaerolineae bacterium]
MRAKQFHPRSGSTMTSLRPVSRHGIGPAVLLVSLLLSGGSPAAASSPAQHTEAPTAAAAAQIAICPASIGFGETIQCAIDAPGEVDTYTFTAGPGDRVLVKMSKSSGELMPRIEVYEPGGDKVCEAGTVLSTEIANCTLGAGGTYTIRAFGEYDKTKTGGYNLYLQRLNNPGNVLPIAFGQTLPGSILMPAQMDTYTFTAAPGDRVLLRMGKSSGSLFPRIRVYDAGGDKVCEDGTYYLPTAEVEGCALASGGTYMVLLSDDYGGTKMGDYYLHVQRLNGPVGPGSIGFGQTLSGSIPTPAQMNPYTFTAEPGDRVLLRMSQSSGSLLPGIRVYEAGGAKVCEAGTPLYKHMAEIAGCTLTGGGTYFVLAFDDYVGTNNTGGYHLYVQRLNNPGNGLPIDRGAELVGTIVNPAQMDTYTFTITTSDTVRVRMRAVSGNLHPGIRLYGPDGTLLCEDEASGTAEITDCALPGSGAYTILAFDSSDGTCTGDYRLSLDCCTVNLPLILKTAAFSSDLDRFTAKSLRSSGLARLTLGSTAQPSR